MAHLYKQPKSPFWWIKFRDPDKPLLNSAGKEVPRRESTGLRIGHGHETREARELEARRTLAERAKRGRPNEGWGWVDGFIADQYSLQPQTLTRFKTAWRTIKMFLKQRQIAGPRFLTYDHAGEYLKWREEPDNRIGKYAAGRNTALLEIKFLGLVMKQAMRKGLAQGNPWSDIGMKRTPPKTKADFTDEHLQLIAAGIRAEPDEKRAFLWPSFLVAIHHGVRLMETNVNPRRDVKLWTTPQGVNMGEITFHQKMGRVRTKPLHPALYDFFYERRAASVTFEMPKSFAKEWHNFFKRCGLRDRIAAECKALDMAVEIACFHCFRVTVNNRLRRSGIHDVVRKRYLSHEKTEDVNEVYNRVLVDEMRVCHAALDFKF